MAWTGHSSLSFLNINSCQIRYYIRSEPTPNHYNIEKTYVIDIRDVKKEHN
jgi:hypothetical protein